MVYMGEAPAVCESHNLIRQKKKKGESGVYACSQRPPSNVVVVVVDDDDDDDGRNRTHNSIDARSSVEGCASTGRDQINCQAGPAIRLASSSS